MQRRYQSRSTFQIRGKNKSERRDLYEILKCCGCDAIRMRVTTASRAKGKSATTIYYPRRSRRRGPPPWVEDDDGNLILLRSGSLNLLFDIIPLMEEVYLAIDNHLLRLAAMGIRAVLEAVMKSKVGDYNFAVLLDRFQKADYISTRQHGTLGEILEVGHAAAHRGWEPTESDITTLLDITEGLIKGVFFHEDDARTLYQKVPKRPPRVSQS